MSHKILHAVDEDDEKVSGNMQHYHSFFTNRSLADSTNLLSLYMLQIKTRQDRMSENYTMLNAMLSTFVFPFTMQPHKMAGIITLNRHTMMLSVVSLKLCVSSGRSFAISSILKESTR